MVFSAFIENKSLYRAFGFIAEQPALVGFLLFNDVWQPVDHIIKWFMQVNSRRNEYGAGTPSFLFEIETDLDQFARSLGYQDELARALIKLQIKNLSAMDADWLYSAYNHSHPILVERLRALGYKGGEDILKMDKMDANGKVE
jgi:STE24 endopeptidase